MIWLYHEMDNFAIGVKSLYHQVNIAGTGSREDSGLGLAVVG